METIGNQSLWSLLDGASKAERVSNSKVRLDQGHFVSSYLDLVAKIAALQFRNRDYVFLFRGQPTDYKNRANSSSLRPSLLRAKSIPAEFEKLRQAEDLLVDKYRFTGFERVVRHQALRWAILQHYRVCGTPLLDVTQSLRIAASFASEPLPDPDTFSPKAFLYVLGVPNISGAITASDEAGLEVIRLSSVCPPEAVRPHIQEGYLLSEYPELSNFKQQEHYEKHELDFGKRLIAKFRFDPNEFWRNSKEFPRIPHSALYPNSSDDPVHELTESIKTILERKK